MSNPEYLEYRCCMCPNVNKKNHICPGIPGTPHPNESPCRFVKIYVDERGWKYFVRSGIGGSSFKAFYLKTGKAGGGHGCRWAWWKDSFDEAQAELNRVAKNKDWKEI